MRWLLVMLVLLASGPGFAEERPAVYVEISETGAAGSEAATTAEAVARILVSAGLPVTLGRGGRDCGTSCVHVTLHRETADDFALSARYGRRSARTSVRLPAAASVFDRTHALAIQVELLVDDVLSAGPPRPEPAAATPAHHPVAPPDDEPLSEPLAPRPDPAHEAELASAQIASPPRTNQPFPVSQGVQAVAPAPAPQRPVRIAFQADATSLGTATGGLITFGFSLALRVPLGDRFDARLAVAMLDADRDDDGERRFWRKLNPVALYTTTSLPGFTSMRAGAGLEAVAMVGDDLAEKHDPSSTWSLGVLAHFEYRLPVRSFVARMALETAYHPFKDRLITDTVMLMEYPHWTVGASLGLEFRLW